jgi:monoamine oxidase
VSEEDLEAPIILNGKKLTAEESEQLWEEMEKAFNTIVTDAAKVDATQPWTAANAEALDKRTLADWINKLSASPICKAALHAMQMADNGVVSDWQSYLGNLAVVKGGGLEKYWTESEVYRCRGGNQQLAAKFAAAIGAPRILTRMPVRSIAMTDKLGRVTLGSGKVLEAEHVLLTAPPSVWNKIAIDPVLPAALAPQMGTNIKYLMSLKSPVWRRSKMGPELLSDGPVSMTWHATDGQKGAGEAMVAFSGGPSADACREWTATQRDRNYLAELNKVYRGITASFVRARFMDWPSDPWTKGSYSFPAPGQVTAQGPTLYNGLGRLHFAGEYTCYAFVGFMEGALNSGAAVAKRIAEKDGVVTKSAA